MREEAQEDIQSSQRLWPQFVSFSHNYSFGRYLYEMTAAEKHPSSELHWLKLWEGMALQIPFQMKSHTVLFMFLKCTVISEVFIIFEVLQQLWQTN